MKPAQGAINSHAKHLLGGAAHTEWCLDAHSHGQLAVSHCVEDFTTDRHSKQFFFLKNEQFWILTDVSRLKPTAAPQSYK